MILIKKKKIPKLSFKRNRKRIKINDTSDTKIPPPPIQRIRKFRSETRTSAPPPPSPLASNEGKSLNRSVSGKLSGPIESKGRRIVEPINRETVAFVPPL